MSKRIFRRTDVLVLVLLMASSAAAQDVDRGAEVVEADAVARDPLSVQAGGEVLPLATAGPKVLPPLPVRRGCCGLLPDLSCAGPSYRTCQPLIYYGKNPRHDDWTNPLYQCACGCCGDHWYHTALRGVLRHKAFAERLAH